MDAPLFSIVIPAYNNAAFLGDAIRSVLTQTHPRFELIVVNDASPDDVGAVVRRFSDSRIHYIVHEQNRGLSAARNTGIRRSSGDRIALLDGDDYFHPDKLRAHADFVQQHAGVDVTYNARFELNHSATTIRELWRPPAAVGLGDLILGYPFSPSDMVVRRDRLLKVGLFDVSHTYYGEDLDINCRLALEGCTFASVDRALNYRRYHSRRVIKNLRAYQNDEVRPLRRTFADPRFPAALADLQDKAVANRYLFWSLAAYLQDDMALGRDYAAEAVRLNRALIAGTPCELLQQVVRSCTLDENVDHEQPVRRILRELPPRLGALNEQADWAVARGYLARGARAVMWGRRQDGKAHFSKARRYQAVIDRSFLEQTSAQVLNYEAEYGSAAAECVLTEVCRVLEETGQPRSARRLRGHHAASKAFHAYAAGKRAKVARAVVRAFVNDPSYVLNRGMIKILAHSLVAMNGAGAKA